MNIQKIVVICAILTLLVLILFSLNGCSNKQEFFAQNIGAKEILNSPVQDSNAEYILQKGDVLEVKFFYNSELNDKVTIRPDGRISLQLVNEIQAFGLTPAQLNKILTEKYTRFLNNPEVAVIVKEFAGQKIYVGGEVLTPGEFTLTSNMTALEAIFQAGGFRETAKPASVIIISKGPQNTPVNRTVDLQNLMAGGPAVREVYLKPFDVVYVPKTSIAETNKFVDQYIRNLIPINLNAGFSYIIYRGKGI
jgi:polysaccharide export outer membrane protein